MYICLKIKVYKHVIVLQQTIFSINLLLIQFSSKGAALDNLERKKSNTSNGMRLLHRLLRCNYDDDTEDN